MSGVTLKTCPDRPDGQKESYCFRGYICMDTELGHVKLHECEHCSVQELGDAWSWMEEPCTCGEVLINGEISCPYCNGAAKASDRLELAESLVNKMSDLFVLRGILVMPVNFTEQEVQRVKEIRETLKE